jgi:hypothetical protein
MQTVSTYLDSLTSEQLGITIFGHAQWAHDQLTDRYLDLPKEEFLAVESELLTPGGYRVDNLSNSFVSGQDVQMQVTHVETQQVVMAYTMREGEWVERPETDPNAHPRADYSGDTVTVHHFDESFKVELVSAFMDISQKAGLVASTYLEAAGEDTIDVELPNGLFFMREYRDAEVWRDLVFSSYDVSSEGNHYAVAQNFSSGAGMGLPMSEQTEQLILQEFNQQVELYQQTQQQQFSQQQVQQRESVPQVSVPVEQQPEVPTLPQDEVDSTAQAHSSKPKPTLRGNRPMATVQTPEAQTQTPQKQKTAEFKYFQMGGARVAGPAANLIATSMKDKGVELKQFANGGSYVTLKANQVPQAMAIAGRCDYQINKVSYKEWAPQAKTSQTQTPQAPQAQAPVPTQPTKAEQAVESVPTPLTPDADLSTVIKGNVFAAAALQQNGESKVPTLAAMREKDVVTVSQDGSVRIDKGAKDGKGVMILGKSKDGNFYAAHKGLTDVDGKLQAVDPAQNKQPALLYREDAVGNALTNRVAEANQVLPKPLDFSNVATAIRQNMPQLKADIAAEAKTKAKAGAAR